MKKILCIAMGVVLVSLFMAASRQHTITPSGNITTKTRSASQFSEISVAQGIVVYLQQGDEQKVVVRTDNNAIEYVITEVRNGKLSVRYSDNVRVRRIKTEVYVTAKRINSISASSSGEVEIKGTLSGDKLEATASSASDIEGKVNYNSISATASSGADIELSGTAKRVNITATSGSDIDIENLRADIVSASASSGSDIDVWASKQLDATASSGADISYRGNPENLNVNRSSGGSVHRDN